MCSSRWMPLSSVPRRTVYDVVLDLLPMSHSVACYLKECELTPAYCGPCNTPACPLSSCLSCVAMYSGTILGGKSVCEAEMNDTQYCLGGVVLHPCCVGLLGQCIVTTKDNCTFQRGHWYPDKVLLTILNIVPILHTIHSAASHCFVSSCDYRTCVNLSEA